jgi:sialidase-1
LPDHPRARINITVCLSYDEGRTWPIKKVIDPGPSAYSDLAISPVIQNDRRNGPLYEQGNQGGSAFVGCTLEWLTGGQEAIDAAGALNPS